ncbi:MAG: hypothetical protein IKT44_02325 [Clostridia bacterium]|nr:hypothetical protein [Clostridia bacterium]
MKKVISILLVIGLMFSFCACSKDGDKNKNKVDLEYYAKLGQMPEAKYTLGEDPDTVIDGLNKLKEQAESEHEEDPNHNHDHDEQEFLFEIVQGEKNVLLDNGNICYYFNKANEDKGISYIVNYDSAFGFPLGTVILEVKNALGDTKLTEEPLTEENAFFASYVLDGTILKAEFENATIVFVFQENELFATAIYNSNWKN